jgi:hypothetical protein
MLKFALIFTIPLTSLLAHAEKPYDAAREQQIEAWLLPLVGVHQLGSSVGCSDINITAEGPYYQNLYERTFSFFSKSSGNLGYLNNFERPESVITLTNNEYEARWDEGNIYDSNPTVHRHVKITKDSSGKMNSILYEISLGAFHSGKKVFLNCSSTNL